MIDKAVRSSLDTLRDRVLESFLDCVPDGGRALAVAPSYQMARALSRDLAARGQGGVVLPGSGGIRVKFASGRAVDVVSLDRTHHVRGSPPCAILLCEPGYMSHSLVSDLLWSFGWVRVFVDYRPQAWIEGGSDG